MEQGCIPKLEVVCEPLTVEHQSEALNRALFQGLTKKLDAGRLHCEQPSSLAEGDANRRYTDIHFAGCYEVEHGAAAGDARGASGDLLSMSVVRAS